MSTRFPRTYFKPFLAAVFLYVFFLLATIPAWVLDWGLAKATENAVRISGAQGSVWRGMGTIMILTGNGQWQDTGLVRWTLQPWGLFMGRLQVGFKGSRGPASVMGRAALAPGKIILTGLRGRMPAAYAQTIYPAAAALGLGGEFNFQGSRLEFGKAGLSGQAFLTWENASCKLSAVQPLGTYRLKLDGRGQIVNLELSTEKGDLEIKGNGQCELAQSGRIQFVGGIKPLQRTAELSSFLNLIGSGDASGYRPLTLATSLF